MGLCVAYLALPRLRYQRRIDEAFLRFQKEKNACIAPYIESMNVKKRGAQKNENLDIEIEDISNFRDSSLTKINEKVRQFRENEYGSWFFKHCFQPKNSIGMDQMYISALVAILFFLLFITTIIPELPASASVFVSLSPFVVRWDIFIIGWGFFIVLFLISLIWSGNKHITEIENLLKDGLSIIESTYSTDPYVISIHKMTTDQ
ncbi:MAG: hypothetical protein KJ550_12520 [Proteobacteria bacterium]|nr:hypothetical protein [Desulfobacteraceae bacterium]MBU4014268.1 hypothetical protein [Pseudomonadota bacterium]